MISYQSGKLSFDKELTREDAKKKIITLCSFLKLDNQQMLSSWFDGMAGMNKEPTPQNFQLYEGEEEIQELRNSVKESLGITKTGKDINNAIDVYLESFSLKKDDNLIFCGICTSSLNNSIAYVIYKLVRDYLYGDVNSIFFINEML